MTWRTVAPGALTLLAVFVATVCAASHRHRRPQFVEENLNTGEIILEHGYAVEEHFVTTEDGYILRLFRSAPAELDPQRPPVLMQHGFLCSSADWVLNGPNSSLAYQLADAGYDIWLSNARGNTYSRNHTRLDPDTRRFWKFSWHEQGVYDLPAVIDYILNVTGQTDLIFIGHSMGTTMFFVMCSEKPEYNAKIRLAICLAPVAYMNHITSPLLRFLADWEGPLAALLKLMGIGELSASDQVVTLAADVVCRDRSVMQEMCANIIFLLAGYNPKELNETRLPVYLSHTPAGASVAQAVHYGQEIMSGHFRQFDLGPWHNLRRYGKRHPPDYELRRVTAPVALYYGHRDCLAAPKDVLRLYKELGNPIGLYAVDEESWSHLDFLWGMNAKHLVFDKIMQQISQFSQNSTGTANSSTSPANNTASSSSDSATPLNSFASIALTSTNENLTISSASPTNISINPANTVNAATNISESPMNS